MCERLLRRDALDGLGVQDLLHEVKRVLDIVPMGLNDGG